MQYFTKRRQIVTLCNIIIHMKCKTLNLFGDLILPLSLFFPMVPKQVTHTYGVINYA